MVYFSKTEDRKMEVEIGTWKFKTQEAMGEIVCSWSRIQLQINKLAMGVENKATGDSKLNDSFKEGLKCQVVLM